ncbi:MAG: T9SS type A sorting domain-containing protein [Flavobacteriia bacterium]
MGLSYLLRIILLACFVACLFPTHFFAATITSTPIGGNWSSATTWIGGVVPTTNDDVIIVSGATVTSSTTNDVCRDVSVTGTLNFLNASRVLNVGRNLTLFNGGTIHSGSTTGTLNVLGNVIIGSVSTDVLTIGRVSLNVSGSTEVNGNAKFISALGGKTFMGNVIINNGGQLSFTAAETLTLSANLLTSGNITIGGGGVVGIINLTGDFSLASAGTAILGGIRLNITGSVVIPGAAILDASVGTNTLTLAGSWLSTSNASVPFLCGSTLITLNGTSGTQQIACAATSGETFNNLTINNTSSSTYGIQFLNHVNVSGVLNLTAGNIDLKGKNLNLNGAPIASQLSYFTAGTIKNSVAGGAINITDVNNFKSIYFSGTNFGDNVNGVPITCVTNDSYFHGGVFYGTVNFTKTGTGINYSNGGCTFYGPCTFSTTASSQQWMLGNINPDIYYNATFNHYTANGSNFTVARQSLGNQFYGTTTIYSESQGGFFVGRGNVASNCSAVFHGPVVVTVAGTGNAYFGESTATSQSTITFQSTLQLNSTPTSTGDIYIGNSPLSTINFTTTGQLIDGTLSGATNVYLNKVTQVGTLSQTCTSTAASSSTFVIGCGATISAANIAPCVFNGSVNITSPNINICGSTFNGSSNSFQTNGTASQNCYGGNTFASGTNSTFFNNGPGNWRLANFVADDYNGNVIYRRASGSGFLSPAYNTNCTYAGNITVFSSSDSLDFANSTNGRVTIDGSSSTSLINASSKGCSIKRLTINKTGAATFTLNNRVAMPTGGNLTLTNGVVNAASATLYLMDESVTVNATMNAGATSYINGKMRYDVSTTTNQTLNFPIGKGSDCRPFILYIKHSGATSYSYVGELFNTSAEALSWSKPATVSTVSLAHYWDIKRYLTTNQATEVPSTLLSGNQSVQFFYGPNDGVIDPSGISICKNTNLVPTSWVDIGGVGTASGSGSITSTSTPTAFNSFSRFTIANKTGSFNPLPIELVDFTAEREGEVALIKWETATEINNDYFTLERSKDGVAYEVIAVVEGAGNSTNEIEYRFIDEFPLAGISYYRLKQTDYDGNYTYSDKKSIYLESETEMLVYPNPSNGNVVHIELNGGTEKDLNYQVLNMNAQLVQAGNLKAELNNEGLFQINFEEKLQSGIYLLKVDLGNKSLLERIVIN